MDIQNHICILCNYSTSILCNYQKHCKTKKHLKKMEQNLAPLPHLTDTSINFLNNNLQKELLLTKIYTCNICNINFARLDNLNRHRKICINISFNQKEQKYINEINKLKEQLAEKEHKYVSIINEKNNIINHKNELLEAKKDHLKDMKKTISFERKLSKQQFLDKYLPDNPELNKLEDYTIIHQEYKSIDIFCRDIIRFYQRKQLHIYLGDFIVSHYCKKNINEQSLFTSDVSRNNFLYSTNNNTKLNKKSKKSIWINDKNGINIANRIIDPLLDYIHKIIVSFSKSIVINIKSKKLNGAQSLNSATEILECEHIIALLENDQLKQNIIKHISPYFDIIKDKILEKMNINNNILEDKKI